MQHKDLFVLPLSPFLNFLASETSHEMSIIVISEFNFVQTSCLSRPWTLQFFFSVPAGAWHHHPPVFRHLCI